MTNKTPREQAIEKIISVLLDVHSNTLDEASFLIPNQHHPTLTERANEILELLESLGYVQLDKHEIEHIKLGLHGFCTMCDSIRANFVKVEKE